MRKFCARCGHSAEVHGIQSEEGVSRKAGETYHLCNHHDGNSKCDCEGYLPGG